METTRRIVTVSELSWSRRVDDDLSLLVPGDPWFRTGSGTYLEGEDAADVFMSGPILASTAAVPDTDALA